MVNVPIRNIIGVTEVSRDTSKYITAAGEGQSFIVVKNNKPIAALVPPELLDRMTELDEREQDLRMLCLAVVRIVTDSGNRHDLDDVLTELGISLDEA